MAGIQLLKTLAADIPTPATDRVTLFIEDADGRPYYKDESGVVHSLHLADIGVPLMTVIDGGGYVITTGAKGDIVIPFGGTITKWTLLGDTSGSIVIDLYKCTYSQYDAGSTHPVVGDKITASAPPTISAATKGQSSTLTGWTTAITSGDIIRPYVSSVSTLTRVTLCLEITRAVL